MLQGLVSIDEFKDLILNYDSEVLESAETSQVSPLHKKSMSKKSPRYSLTHSLTSSPTHSRLTHQSMRDIFDIPTKYSSSTASRAGSLNMVPTESDVESNLYNVYK